MSRALRAYTESWKGLDRLSAQRATDYYPDRKLANAESFLTEGGVSSILSIMDKFQTDLNGAFAALADPTRRAIVGLLCEGPQSVSELSKPFEMALPSLLKHVRVLEQSGLVSSAKTGRVRTCRIEPHALRATELWIHQHIAAWERRLDRMEAHIERMKRKH